MPRNSMERRVTNSPPSMISERESRSPASNDEDLYLDGEHQQQEEVNNPGNRNDNMAEVIVLGDDEDENEDAVNLEEDHSQEYFELRTNFDSLVPGGELKVKPELRVFLIHCVFNSARSDFPPILTAKCVSSQKDKTLKFYKDSTCSQREIKNLQFLKSIEENQYFLLMEESLTYEVCLVMEPISFTLEWLVLQDNSSNRPFERHFIRPVAQQALCALRKLHSMKIIHRNVSSYSIVFIPSKDKYLRVKLMDFSCAHTKEENGLELESCHFLTAPEIHLGIDFDESVDIWSLGCTLARLLLIGRQLFPGASIYDTVRFITGTLGDLPAHMINKSPHKKVLTSRDDENIRRWLPLEEYLASNPDKSTVNLEQEVIPDLDVALSEYCDTTQTYHIEDNDNLIRLIFQMLQIDPKKRIKLESALQSKFITMSSLTPCEGLSEYIGFNEFFM